MTSNASVSRRPEDDEEAYPYVLTNEIGKGSFATVFRGYHVVRVLYYILLWRLADDRLGGM